jgi:hypothetical protein
MPWWLVAVLVWVLVVAPLTGIIVGKCVKIAERRERVRNPAPVPAPEQQCEGPEAC